VNAPAAAPVGSNLLADVTALLGDARRAAPDPATAEVLDEALRRAHEPLRVAIAGRVKAGKSTLLNALVGDELAATDAGECTRVVTWYRNGHTYRVEMQLGDGAVHQCPFRHDDGILRIDLGGTPVEEVDRLVVWWPSARLEDLILVDTPGIGSISTDLAARTYQFLVGDADDEPGAADAVLYLLRHLHGNDIRFLEAFHDDEVGAGTPVNALGVLARSDEIGGCRLDAMATARRVADRYVDDPRIRQLCRVVLPVAGLLAQAGATLREDEFRHLAAIAGAGAQQLVDLELTADRFVAPDAPVDVPADARWELVGRLGLFGVRLAIDLLNRGRVRTSPELAAALVDASGIADLQAALRSQFTSRSQALKARSSLATLSALFRSAGSGDARRWQRRVEQIAASAHEIVEIQLLNELWLGELPVPDEARADEMARLLGGFGTSPTSRLGLADEAPVDEQRAAALAAARRWQGIAEHPLSPVRYRDAARSVARSCEGVLVGLAGPVAAEEPGR
jgi:hypothetical protein